jgi:hypothetical protein
VRAVVAYRCDLDKQVAGRHAPVQEVGGGRRIANYDRLQISFNPGLA